MEVRADQTSGGLPQGGVAGCSEQPLRG